jgi:hypothetical protein
MDKVFGHFLFNILLNKGIIVNQRFINKDMVVVP